MRILLAMTATIAIAGCATSPGSAPGANALNPDEPVRVERLGSITTAELPQEKRCNSKQVKWCSDGDKGCRCVYKHVARDRLRRMEDQMRNLRQVTNQRRNLN